MYYVWQPRKTCHIVFEKYISESHIPQSEVKFSQIKFCLNKKSDEIVLKYSTESHRHL